MHELTMCESMLATLTGEYERYLAESRPRRIPRVTQVRIVIGALHQIVPESFRLAYELLTKDTALAGSALELEIVPVKIRCRTCAWEGDIRPPAFLCARCGQGDVETLAGRELYIKDMELEDDEPENL